MWADCNEAKNETLPFSISDQYKPWDDFFKLFNAAEGLDHIFCDSPKD